MEKTDYSLLVIDKNTNELGVIHHVFHELKEKGIHYSITVARSIDEAKKYVAHDTDIDLVIIALNFPNHNGLEIIRTLQEIATTLPIIVISTLADEEVIRQTIRLGAQDYLSEDDLHPMHLHFVIQASIERNQLRKSLQALSFTDEMTGLYNRRGFFTLLEQQVALTKRLGRGFYLFLIDIDNLKTINDTYGHPIGDRALVDVAHCLTHSFRHHDIIGRIGGDEFAVIALNASEHSDDKLKQNINQTLTEKNQHTTAPYRVSVSIGTSYFYGTHEISIQELVHSADMALYAAKKEQHFRLKKSD